jgi:hypothetical protein
VVVVVAVGRLFTLLSVRVSARVVLLCGVSLVLLAPFFMLFVAFFRRVVNVFSRVLYVYFYVI